MKINWVTIRVADMAAAREFYEGFLSMKPAREFSPYEGTKIVFYEAENGVSIELIHSTEGTTLPAGNNVSVGIMVDNYDELKTAAVERGMSDGSTMKLGPDMECFFVRDNDGVGIQIIGK